MSMGISMSFGLGLGLLTGLTLHGGADDAGPIAWDFSTNANPLALPAHLIQALADTNRRHYPDPAYTALRERLAHAQGLSVQRMVPTAGSSEGIRRLTLAASLLGVREVWVPEPGYGDYRAAAQALGLSVKAHAQGGSEVPVAANAEPCLVWWCDPCNPTGTYRGAGLQAAMQAMLAQRPQAIFALDRAYEALVLTAGLAPLPPAWLDRCWQLCSPNKALGLTGVRAGWLVAPQLEPAQPPGLQITTGQLQTLAPSWVLSAEGVSMLMHWHDDATQQWLEPCRRTLAQWRDQQQAMLRGWGWWVQASDTPFFLAQPAGWHPDALRGALQTWRQDGLKLRDTSSLGLPNGWRLSTQHPEAQAALQQAWWRLSDASPTTGT